MSYLTARYFDVSIVTRLRLKTWDGVSPAVRAVVIGWVVCSALALLHLATGLAFILNGASGQAAGLHGLPLDDAWVHLVYARNFAEGFTLAYNPGAAEAGATSPLWAVLLGLSYQALAFTGATLPAIAKLLGIILALGVSLVALKLVHKVTGNQVLGVAAAAVIALEPSFSFAKVSGTEASLFGFVALAAASAFYHRRLTLTGLLLGLAVAARPEGVLLAALTLAALAVKLLWERGDFRLVTRQDLAIALRLALPPALVGLTLVLFNLATNGTLYPNSYLVKHIPLGLFNSTNLWNLAQGYLLQTSFFSMVGIMATVPLLILAGIRYCGQGRFAALPLVAFPLALYYALSVTLALDPAPWDITLRRYLDPSLPFIAVGLMVGLYHARQLLGGLGLSLRRGTPAAPPDHRPPARGLKAGSTAARWASLALTLLFLLLAAMPYVMMPGRWVGLTNQYSRESRNVHQTGVAAAGWMDQNLPADTVIGTADAAGTIRFFGAHRVVDLTGINTRTAIGRPLFQAAEAHGVDYLVAFRNIYLDSWPLGEEVAAFATQQNAATAGAELVVYRTDWDRPINLADKALPHTIDTSGLRLLDSLDVGVPAQEEAHFYSLSQPGSLVERIFHVAQYGGSRVAIRDEARTTTGFEEFVTRSEPGQPLIIAKRYDAAVGGSVAVYVDGNFVGDWHLAPREFVFGEDTFRVGRELITGTTTVLRFQHLQRPGAALNSFYYWVYTVR